MHYIKKDLSEVRKEILEEELQDFQQFEDDIWPEDLKIIDGELIFKTEEDKLSEELENKFSSLETYFNYEIDVLVNYLKTVISEKETLSPEQVERYEAKYQIALKAKDGDEDAIALLEIEAGGDATELIDLIIEMGNDWNLSLNTLLSLIDAFRVRIQNLISQGSDYEYVEGIVKSFLALGISELTVENVKTLFE